MAAMEITVLHLRTQTEVYRVPAVLRLDGKQPRAQGEEREVVEEPPQLPHRSSMPPPALRTQRKPRKTMLLAKLRGEKLREAKEEEAVESAGLARPWSLKEGTAE